MVMDEFFRQVLRPKLYASTLRERRRVAYTKRLAGVLQRGAPLPGLLQSEQKAARYQSPGPARLARAPSNSRRYQCLICEWQQLPYGDYGNMIMCRFFRNPPQLRINNPSFRS